MSHHGACRDLFDGVFSRWLEYPTSAGRDMSYLLNAHPLLLVGLIPLWAFVLRQAVGLFQGELPTWRRAAVNVVLSGGVAFLAYDLGGYAFLKMFGDKFIELPDGYGYRNWIAETLRLKWEVLGLVPGVRFLPIVFALCAGGAMQTMTLVIPFREGVLVFLGAWGVNLAILVVGGLLQVLVVDMPPTVDSELRVKAHPGLDKATMTGILANLMPKVELDAKGELVLTPRKAKTGSETKVPPVNKAKASGSPPDDWVPAWLRPFDPYLEPIKARTAPVVSQYPELKGVLNAGGWWALLAMIGALALCWSISITRRGAPLVAWLINDYRAARAPKEEAAPGPARLTVQGAPGRIHSIVVAFAAMEGERLDDDLVYRALDAILPNLGALVAADSPQVRRWGRQLSTTVFARTFFERCRPADADDNHWSLVAGTITLGEQRIHVGLVLRTLHEAATRQVTVVKEKWRDVFKV